MDPASRDEPQCLEWLSDARRNGPDARGHQRIRHSDDEYVVEVEPRGNRFEQHIDLDYGGDPDRLDEKRPARVVISDGGTPTSAPSRLVSMPGIPGSVR